MNKTSAAPPGLALERPVLAVDVVLLTVLEGRLAVLLHRRRETPFRGQVALPGVAVRVDETLEAAARRALIEKARLAPADGAAVFLEQLATFDALFRDPRGRTVSTVYLGLCSGPLVAAAGEWRSLAEQPRGSLPFDHDEILAVAVARLRGKVRWTPIARHLLAPTFRLEEIERVFTAILDRPLNRANFRTWLLRVGLLERAGVLPVAPSARGGRPPHLYRFAAEARPADPAPRGRRARSRPPGARRDPTPR